MKSPLLLALLLAASANAQTVYRVGSTYTDKPLPQAVKVSIVLNLMQAEDVPFVSKAPMVRYVPPTAPTPKPVRQPVNVVVQVTVNPAPVYLPYYNHHWRHR